MVSRIHSGSLAEVLGDPVVGRAGRGRRGGERGRGQDRRDRCPHPQSSPLLKVPEAPDRDRRRPSNGNRDGVDDPGGAEALQDEWRTAGLGLGGGRSRPGQRLRRAGAMLKRSRPRTGAGRQHRGVSSSSISSGSGGIGCSGRSVDVASYPRCRRRTRALRLRSRAGGPIVTPGVTRGGRRALPLDGREHVPRRRAAGFLDDEALGRAGEEVRDDRVHGDPPPAMACRSGRSGRMRSEGPRRRASRSSSSATVFCPIAQSEPTVATMRAGTQRFSPVGTLSPAGGRRRSRSSTPWRAASARQLRVVAEELVQPGLDVEAGAIALPEERAPCGGEAPAGRGDADDAPSSGRIRARPRRRRRSACPPSSRPRARSRAPPRRPRRGSGARPRAVLPWCGSAEKPSARNRYRFAQRLQSSSPPRRGRRGCRPSAPMPAAVIVAASRSSLVVSSGGRRRDGRWSSCGVVVAGALHGRGARGAGEGARPRQRGGGERDRVARDEERRGQAEERRRGEAGDGRAAIDLRAPAHATAARRARAPGPARGRAAAAAPRVRRRRAATRSGPRRPSAARACGRSRAQARAGHVAARRARARTARRAAPPPRRRGRGPRRYGDGRDAALRPASTVIVGPRGE